MPEPVRVNVIGTDGQKLSIGSVQLHSLDLGGDDRNVFAYHPDTLELFSYCGYREGRAVLEGLNMDTFTLLSSLISEGA
mgnify:CR=1 FL=1